MFKRILVGFDGSKESLRALNLAINLAKLHGASIKALEVIEHMPVILEAYIKEDTLRDRERIIKHTEIIKRISIENGINIDYEVVRGDPAVVLSKYAESEDFDLIILGKRKLKGLKKVFMESVSSKVLDISKKPVLVVKE
ncbi:universal stress protein [Acidianus hospitalis]|jgi:nucleotide-binding universal stress UspA family protein|uniref:Universal stress protein n=1 Tax=Acidianus hospitalis TaxID=563177 RepID=A0A2T9X9K3_9CREN|nr:universal stress protein [Acidianus hospitalis]